MSLLLSLSLLFTGCEKEADASKEPVQPAGFAELVQAYKDGRIFQSAEHQNGSCVLSFTDGYRLTIADTAFEIDDCTDRTPSKVEASSSLLKPSWAEVSPI